MTSMTHPDFDILASRAVVPSFYRAPHPPSTTPREFQHAGVEYSLARDHSLIGDAPGLGKSCEGVLISNAIRARRTLVICPASLRLNWEREIWMWSMKENVTTYPVFKSSDGIHPESDYVIISYDLTRNPAILRALMALRWDHMILDEAHYLKDPKGNSRTTTICAPDRLPSVVGRITMLSGTILPNQPIECYNAVRLLNWEAINRASLEDFREMYYDIGGGMVRGPVLVTKDDDGNDIEPRWVSKVHWSENVRNVPVNLDDLQYRLRKWLMVRRLKEQVLHELPPKQWHPFPLSSTPGIRKALNHPGWKSAEKLYDLDPSAFDHGIPIDGAVSTARRLLGEAKAPLVADYVEDMLMSGTEKIIVAAWHHTVLAYLRDRLAKYGVVYMDGSTSDKRKQAAVDQFQDDPKIRIIIGQTIPLGVGWNLFAAQDVILAEPDWVPGKNDQLLDRVHRMGQKGSYVIGHIPVVPGTMDERILNTTIVKDQNIYKALDHH